MEWPRKDVVESRTDLDKIIIPNHLRYRTLFKIPKSNVLKWDVYNQKYSIGLQFLKNISLHSRYVF